MAEALPFDRVVVVDNGARLELTTAEFLRIRLQDRVRLILSRQVTFMGGDRPVDEKVALAALRRGAVGSAR